MAPTDRTEHRKWTLQRGARNAYCQQLIAACNAGEIPHVKTKKEESNIYMPEYGEWVPPASNSFLLRDGPSNEWLSEFINRPPPQKKEVTNYDYSIHKDDFKSYLQNIGEWPVDGLLAAWWKDAELQPKKQAKAAQPQAKDVGDTGANSQAVINKKDEATKLNGTTPNERELTEWLRGIWEEEGKPGGTKFFSSLKKYAHKEGGPVIKGSPIKEYYGAGKDAGFNWESSKGNTGEIKKSTILNKVSIFKKPPQQNPVNSKKQE